MFMKTFEEKWTAWLDDELTGDERVAFEASLEDRAAAEAEKNQARKLGALLKEQLQPRAMGNEEFFHHQLRERIARESAPRSPRLTMPPVCARLGGRFAVCSGPAPVRSRSLPSARFSSCGSSRRRISRSTSPRS